MAQPPLHDPNHPARNSAGHMNGPEEKKSKVIPIAIGIVALLVLLFFIVPMFTGDDETETTDTTTEATAPETTPAVTPEAGTDIDDGDTQQVVTVDIEDPAETPAPAPVDAETETTTIPLQEPAPAPAN